jgi:hypothetical protein
MRLLDFFTPSYSVASQLVWGPTSKGGTNMRRKTNQKKLRIEIEELGVLVRGGAYGVSPATPAYQKNPKFMNGGPNASAVASQSAAFASLAGAVAGTGPISAAACFAGGMVCKAVG